MAHYFSKDCRDLSASANRERGGLLLGCAVACGALILIVVLGAFLVTRWLFAPNEIPDPPTAMHPETQSFAMIRLDPHNKPVVDLLTRVAEERAQTIPAEERRLPWPVRWIIGSEPASIIRNFLPIQVVYSDAPGGTAAPHVGLVFSPGRGRGIAAMLVYTLRAKTKGKETEQEFVEYHDKVIVRGKRDHEKSDWWFTVCGGNICAANSPDGVKTIVDKLEKVSPTQPSKVAGLYETLREGAVACGATANLIRVQQVAVWLLGEEGKPAPVPPLQGITLGTFKLTLNDSLTMHAAIELTCVNPQAAQHIQKAMQDLLAARQEAKQISGLRVLQQNEKVYLDLDVPKLDEWLIRTLEQKRRQGEKRETGPGDQSKTGR